MSQIDARYQHQHRWHGSVEATRFCNVSLQTLAANAEGGHPSVPWTMLLATARDRPCHTDGKRSKPFSSTSTMRNRKQATLGRPDPPPASPVELPHWRKTVPCRSQPGSCSTLWDGRSLSHSPPISVSSENRVSGFAPGRSPPRAIPSSFDWGSEGSIRHRGSLSTVARLRPG